MPKKFFSDSIVMAAEVRYGSPSVWDQTMSLCCYPSQANVNHFWSSSLIGLGKATYTNTAKPIVSKCPQSSEQFGNSILQSTTNQDWVAHRISLSFSLLTMALTLGWQALDGWGLHLLWSFAVLLIKPGIWSSAFPALSIQELVFLYAANWTHWFSDLVFNWWLITLSFYFLLQCVDCP